MQLFAEPRSIILAHSAAEVAPALAAIQAASEAGFHVAGAMAYECGYAFEPRLTRLLAAGGKPLLQFGVFDAPRFWAPAEAGPAAVEDLRPVWSFEDYRRRFDICRDYIFAGDVYQ